MPLSRLVRSGRAVSLSRPWNTTGGGGNLHPALHYTQALEPELGKTGGAVDYYGAFYHGRTFTHIDALCHMCGTEGMWNGRDPAREVGLSGSRWGGIDRWSDGVVTRGVLLDIPRFRGEAYVTQDKPVHGWDLEDVARAQGVTIEPGDALAVYSGREKWQAAHSGEPYGTSDWNRKPGLHASCLPFIRDNDISLLLWDMMDFGPDGYDISGVTGPVHSVIYAYGVGLLDNSLLEPLASACHEEGRFEFMLMVAPLKVVGGTGSPVNPIAVF